MRKPLIAANWKMHGSEELVKSFFPRLREQTSREDMDIVVFLPFVYLKEASGYIADNIAIGAQNLSDRESGAFTGEVSGSMLVDVSCQYVLVGHSERRSLYGESDELVAAKFKVAMEAGLIPILCVGESLEEREAGNTLSVVSRQISAVIELVEKPCVANAIIAYEPVWAIGTGKTASPEQAQEVHAAIRGYLGEEGQNTRILYGGSVKATNASALFSQADIDGGLVGGASLDADEFAAICREGITK